MKIPGILLLLFTLTIVVGLSSCSDENTLTNKAGSNKAKSTMEEYYPLSVGSWWIYSVTTLDKNSNEQDDQIFDSVFVNKIVTHIDKDAYELITVSKDKDGKVIKYNDGIVKIDTVYHYFENEKLFATCNEFAEIKYLETEWYLLIDIYAEKWKMLEKHFEGNFQGFDYVMNVSSSGKKENYSEYKFNDINYKCVNIETSTGIHSVRTFFDKTSKVNYSYKTTYTLAKALGVVKKVQEDVYNLDNKGGHIVSTLINCELK